MAANPNKTDWTRSVPSRVCSTEHHPQNDRSDRPPIENDWTPNPNENSTSGFFDFILGLILTVYAIFVVTEHFFDYWLENRSASLLEYHLMALQAIAWAIVTTIWGWMVGIVSFIIGLF